MEFQPVNEPVKHPAVMPHRLAQAEVKRIVYHLNVPAGVPLERVLEADYLSHVASLLRPGYRIEALAEDGKWFADLLVRKSDKEKHTVLCWVIAAVDLEAQVAEAAAPTQDDYKVEFGGAHKWRVVRGGDVIHKGESSEAEARAWLAAHLAGTVTA